MGVPKERLQTYIKEQKKRKNMTRKMEATAFFTFLFYLCTTLSQAAQISHKQRLNWPAWVRLVKVCLKTGCSSSMCSAIRQLIQLASRGALSKQTTQDHKPSRNLYNTLAKLENFTLMYSRTQRIFRQLAQLVWNSLDLDKPLYKQGKDSPFCSTPHHTQHQVAQASL